jgi:hypothetical protein
MKISKIELESHTRIGQQLPEVLATIHRPVGDTCIIVDIFRIDGTEERHSIQANNRGELWSMAQRLQETLDGHKGTGSMIGDYLRILEHFTD